MFLYGTKVLLWQIQHWMQFKSEVQHFSQLLSLARCYGGFADSFKCCAASGVWGAVFCVFLQFYAIIRHGIIEQRIAVVKKLSFRDKPLQTSMMPFGSPAPSPNDVSISLTNVLFFGITLSLRNSASELAIMLDFGSKSAAASPLHCHSA
jgi:hypothetical protein